MLKMLFGIAIGIGSQKPSSTLNINHCKRNNVRQKTCTETSVVCHHRKKVLLINKTTGKP